MSEWENTLEKLKKWDNNLSPTEVGKIYSEITTLRAEIDRWREQSQMEISNYEYEIARRDEIIRKLKEDAERLTSMSQNRCCQLHRSYMFLATDEDEHATDCPITLHRALMKELEK